MWFRNTCKGRRHGEGLRNMYLHTDIANTLLKRGVISDGVGGGVYYYAL